MIPLLDLSTPYRKLQLEIASGFRTWGSPHAGRALPRNPQYRRHLDRSGNHPSNQGNPAVALYGQPADFNSRLTIARRHSLRVIDDAAQTNGARYKGREIGSHSDMVCWSFYLGKNLGALGDAGAITTNDAVLAERVALLRNYGSRQKYVNEEAGMNSRLDPIQAAVLRVKLGVLDEWTERRRAVATAYTVGLVESGLILPHVPEWADPAWHLYVVRTSGRDKLQGRLTEAGSGTLIHYPIPPHMQQAYSGLRIAPDALPLAHTLASEVLSLPMGPHLRDREVNNIVCNIASK